MKITDRKARREGKKDGHSYQLSWQGNREKDPQPTLQQEEPPPFIRKLSKVAGEQIRRIEQHWQKENEGFSSKIAAEEEKLKTLQEEAQRLDLTKAGRPANLRIQIYLIALFIIGLGEFVLNSLVFQVLGRGIFETYLASLPLAIAFPFAAHYVGKKLKEKRDWLGVWILSGMILLSLLGIAYLRANYFEASKIQQLLGISISSFNLSFIFVSVNLLLFSVAVFLAYEAHPENPEARKILDILELTKQSLAWLISQRALRRKRRESQAEEICCRFESLCADYDNANQRARASVDPGQPTWANHLKIPEIPKNLRDIEEQNIQELPIYEPKQIPVRLRVEGDINES